MATIEQEMEDHREWLERQQEAVDAIKSGVYESAKYIRRSAFITWDSISVADEPVGMPPISHYEYELRRAVGLLEPTIFGVLRGWWGETESHESWLKREQSASSGWPYSWGVTDYEQDVKDAEAAVELSMATGEGIQEALASYREKCDAWEKMKSRSAVLESVFKNSYLNSYLWEASKDRLESYKASDALYYEDHSSVSQKGESG